MLCEITESIISGNVFLPAGTRVEIDWTQAKVMEKNGVKNNVVVFTDVSEKIAGELAIPVRALSMLSPTTVPETIFFNKLIQENSQKKVLFADKSLFVNGCNCYSFSNENVMSVLKDYHETAFRSITYSFVMGIAVEENMRQFVCVQSEEGVTLYRFQHGSFKTEGKYETFAHAWLAF